MGWENPVKHRARNRIYRLANLIKERTRVRLWARKTRLEAIEIYSHGENCCACCGEKEMNFLSIDHKNNDGAKHRKIAGTGTTLYHWLKRNKYPTGFQVLCFNCNCAKGFYGKCPHDIKLIKGQR